MSHRSVRKKKGPKPDWADRHFEQFFDEPSDEFIAAWLAHIKATGRPEMFDGVSTTKPPRNGRIVLRARKITVPVKKRDDGYLVPCPICSTECSKFITGYMAWFPLEGVVRFIGHQCGEKYFDPGKFRQAEKDLKQKLATAARRKFLEKNIHLVPDLIDSLEKALPKAQAASQVNKHCALKHRALWQMLGAQVKDANTLYVYDQASTVVSSEFGDRFTSRKVAELSGLTALLMRYEPEKAFRQAINRLKSLHLEEQDDVGEFLGGLNEKEEEFVESAIRNASDVLGKERVRLFDFEQFFTSENLRALTRWGQDRMAPTRLRADLRFEGTRTVFCIDWVSERDYLRVELPHSLFDPIALPPKLIWTDEDNL